ncbi:hypothetical protein Nepgr_005997 [Nepenthes gracilis]|uniref:Methyltransferase n=1 Tax=Nepenthes gracilis TaxID=150966 RepID=A0AAD3S4C5_NEPGR|nr:hypothetical protein Nepgr_005997 [Nepenthes gracilis]
MTIAPFGRQTKTGLARLGRQAKCSHGFCSKMTAIVILGLCFVFVWSFFSTTPNSWTAQRESFDDIADPVSGNAKVSDSRTQSGKHQPQKHQHGRGSENAKFESDLKKKIKEKANGTVPSAEKGRENGKKGSAHEEKSAIKLKSRKGSDKAIDGSERSEAEVLEKDKAVDENEGDGLVDGEEEGLEREEETNEDVKEDVDLDIVEDQELGENEDDGSAIGQESIGKKKKKLGPLFDPKAHYRWRLCGARSKHNYIPCIDNESATRKIQSYRHHERSCPRMPPMCLVPLPHQRYATPVRWPESKWKILYNNVAHPKLASFIKTQSWVVDSGGYLLFPQNQLESKGGVVLYLNAIEEMVPDIEWGRNVRVVLDIGCTDSSFAAFLLDKDVLTLTLGLKDDLVDLAQVALERGFPAIISPFATRRIPFPSGVFDAIHCGGCNIHWHSNGGRLLVEVNRILRPGGYFILSAKDNSIEEEEAMTAFTASICWNVLADKTDEISEVGVKIYQKPESNDIYELRRKKSPPLCNENENADATWYVPIKNCLHAIPAAIEQHGAEWPAEWPKRLETYPEWLSDKEKVKADREHWKAVVEKSYLTGMGIDWENIRNVMDMKAIYGGFAAALLQQKVWVMNVVPVHAPNTLPYIYERGLVGTYHDWCESFGTYPRSYDLLHADHLFSRLKNRCKHPVAIVVEMDRILRPQGWVIIRDKASSVLRKLHGDPKTPSHKCIEPD